MQYIWDFVCNTYCNTFEIFKYLLQYFWDFAILVAILWDVAILVAILWNFVILVAIIFGTHYATLILHITNSNILIRSNNVKMIITNKSLVKNSTA